MSILLLLAGLAFAARLRIAAQAQQVIVAMLARRPVLVGLAPGIAGDVTLQIRPSPLRHIARRQAQRDQALFAARVTPDIETELVERMTE